MADDPREILRPLRRVRQVRQFTAQPPSDAALDAMADVGRWSGSSRNEQPWRFLILRDQAVLRRIWEIGVPQTRALETATAAIAIVLPERGHEIADAYDDGRAAERILIAASFLGLGAAIQWVRNDVRQAVSEILGLPPDRYVRTIVALGHATDAAARPKAAPGAARLPRDESVFRDRWPR
ncbi:MAG TPA: nitroreductase family protein [Candidatus Limnocylindrales bacterium]